MIKYSFKIFKNEKRAEVVAPYEMLSDLSNCSKVQIDEAVEQIELVIAGKLDFYSFGGSDACIIDVAELESMVTYDFGEKDTIVETKELLAFLKEYQQYLKQSK